MFYDRSEYVGRPGAVPFLGPRLHVPGGQFWTTANAFDTTKATTEIQYAITNNLEVDVNIESWSLAAGPSSFAFLENAVKHGQAFDWIRTNYPTKPFGFYMTSPFADASGMAAHAEAMWVTSAYTIRQLAGVPLSPAQSWYENSLRVKQAERAVREANTSPLVSVFAKIHRFGMRAYLDNPTFASPTAYNYARLMGEAASNFRARVESVFGQPLSPWTRRRTAAYIALEYIQGGATIAADTWQAYLEGARDFFDDVIWYGGSGINWSATINDRVNTAKTVFGIA
jgi:hypothetical protein